MTNAVAFTPELGKGTQNWDDVLFKAFGVDDIDYSPSSSATENSFSGGDGEGCEDGDSTGNKAKRKRINDDPEERAERSRERNRLNAKRSRVRKKFLLQSLDSTTRKLTEEIQQLREFIRVNVPAEKSAEFLSTLASPTDTGMDLTERASLDKSVAPESAKKVTTLAGQDFALVQALKGAQHNFVITNPSLPDNPIVYGSDGFFNLTGYMDHEVVGRNCRFLQGPKTDPRAVGMIRAAIAKGEDCHVCMCNYRKDGSTFYNKFFIAPLRGAGGVCENFIGVQCVVSEAQFNIFQKAQFGHLPPLDPAEEGTCPRQVGAGAAVPPAAPAAAE